MSKYFTIEELTRSAVAEARQIDNRPTSPIRLKLEQLIDRCLDPIRECWGGPITVNSGFRCPVLNRAVGGASSSQHMKGEAADITAGSPEENRQLFEMIVSGDFSFDQLIDESHYAWIHISYADGKNRKQILHL